MKMWEKLTRKACRLILAIEGESYVASLNKASDMTYSHSSRILDEMQKAGLVNFELVGRKKLVNLTVKGKEVRDLLLRLKESLR